MKKNPLIITLLDGRCSKRIGCGLSTNKKRTFNSITELAKAYLQQLENK